MKKFFTLLISFSLLALTTVPTFASTNVLFTNIPDPVPGNVPSMGVEAYSMSEIGSQIQLVGTNRTNPKITVLMSSWACQSGTWGKEGNCTSANGATFDHPITLNIYNVNSDNSPGTKITSVTKTFSIPYRPSADPACANGGWSIDGGVNCFNGKAFTINFDLTGITLPEKSIVGIAYNTSHYGYSPIGGTVGPYDSLNVGLAGNPTIGSVLPTSNDIYQNTTYGSLYCDGGSNGTGTFRLDAGCWAGYLPGIKVEANTLPTSPTLKDNCKNDGWKIFNNPTFKNQGDCISWIQSSPKAKGNKK